MLLWHAVRYWLGAGLTRELARWMVHGAADINMRDDDPRRFAVYATKGWQVIKAHEDYKLRHEIPFPHFNCLAGRPVKPSPLYDVLKDKGAVYEENYGFERPRWFAKMAWSGACWITLRNTEQAKMSPSNHFRLVGRPSH
ncbi:MAG: hypothetical protein WBV78_04735 [Roseobacter sp.]